MPFWNRGVLFDSERAVVPAVCVNVFVRVSFKSPQELANDDILKPLSEVNVVAVLVSAGWSNWSNHQYYW